MSMVSHKAAARLASRRPLRSGFAAVGDFLVGLWRVHRTRQALDRLSDSGLNDIGLRRDESLSMMNPYSRYRPWDGL
ncbi:DUF1127 domain-containing protein [Radicibacter daui]|uniref:DUF1127 domain-containing protein n=1 Tax=Radicibacter daui TaxID=3064829 RepID=UPI004046AD08